MTAKEELREFVDDLTEEEAANWLPLAEPSFVSWLEATSKRLSTEELLEMPPVLRGLILRYEARFYTTEDAEADLAVWDEWQEGTGADVDLIDG